jgi:hypothetical protein
MESVELLLSDEYVAFSNRIAEIHVDKKKKKEDFKVVYAEFQQNLVALDEEAKKLAEEWEAWKEGQGKTTE